MTGCQGQAHFQRDYLPPLPQNSYRACQRKGLRYDTGFALQRRMLSFVQDRVVRIFSARVAQFWIP